MRIQLRRRMVVGILGATVLLAGLGIGQGVMRAQGAGKPDRADVVLMRCKVGATRITVTARERSNATPDRKEESCAQALADLIGAGFEIRDTGYSRDADFVIYTLGR
jgi:hypothetical protein